MEGWEGYSILLGKIFNWVLTSNAKEDAQPLAPASVSVDCVLTYHFDMLMLICFIHSCFSSFLKSKLGDGWIHTSVL